jgi:hypothetical protein
MATRPIIVVPGFWLGARASAEDAEGHDWPWLRGLEELRKLTCVDLPTSHWPMWSRPAELAAIIADMAGA